MTDREKMATEFFEQGFNCAQGVLLTHAQALGLDKEIAARMAAAFGGGICLTGNTCGAVTGALMALGVKYGNKAPDEKAAKEKTVLKSVLFMHHFTQACGSVLCRDLLGVDLSQPGVLEHAREMHLFEKTCPRYVGTAADILDAMFNGEK
ncbi:MAG: C_GCAxxG_C_C family protein [Desulfatibacillum sp.]|nr:C_GCAxxG_C_C family protein [Desulfatibacillum sp.]